MSGVKPSGAGSFDVVGGVRGGAQSNGVDTIRAILNRPNQGGGPLTANELQKAIEAGGLKTDSNGKLSLPRDAAEALGKGWASLFTGAGFLATPDAQFLMKVAQQALNIPQYPVM